MREELENLRSTMREKESELWRIEHGDLDELDPQRGASRYQDFLTW